jgi:hypothetical protein
MKQKYRCINIRFSNENLNSREIYEVVGTIAAIAIVNHHDTLSHTTTRSAVEQLFHCSISYSMHYQGIL